jgi:hypothetical protein
MNISDLYNYIAEDKKEFNEKIDFAEARLRSYRDILATLDSLEVELFGFNAEELVPEELIEDYYDTVSSVYDHEYDAQH